METSLVFCLISFLLSIVYGFRYLIEGRCSRYKGKAAIAFFAASVILFCLFQGWISVLHIERALSFGDCTFYPLPGGAHQTICKK